MTHERINLDALYPQSQAAKLCGIGPNQLADLIKSRVIVAKTREAYRPSAKPGAKRMPPRVYVLGSEIVKFIRSLPDKQVGVRPPPTQPPPQAKVKRRTSPQPLLDGPAW